MFATTEPTEITDFFTTPPTPHDPADRCRCTYHQYLRDIAAWDGPTPDSDYLYEPEEY